MRREIIAVVFCLSVVGACSGSDFSAQGPIVGGNANASGGAESTKAGSSGKPGVGKGGSANTGGKSVAGEGPSAAGDTSMSSGGEPGSGGSNAGTAGGGPGGGTSAAGSNAGTSAGGSSAGGGMGGSGGAPQCSTQQTCTASSKCKVAVCSNGKCIEGNQPDGPLALQVAGDCTTVTCAGGNVTSVVATGDKDDLNECTIDGCDQDGTPHHKANGGVHCANGGGFCSFDGKCETCDMTACPKATACTQPLCTNGTCQSAPRPRGTLCNIEATDADQCDGAGTCVECTDSGGCGECCACFSGACLPV